MPLRSYLDLISHECIAGWAWDTDAPDTPVSLVVSANDQVIGRVLADGYRADLEQAAIGDGRHGFTFRPSPPLSPLKRYLVGVRREGDGAHLERSPQTLEPSTAFDKPAQDAIAQLLSAVIDEDDFVRRLTFLTDQIDRLRQRHADYSSGAEDRQRRRAHQWNGSADGATATNRDIGKPRALVIDERMPLRHHDAGSNAILSHIGSLQRIGYDVTFAPANLHGDGSALEAEGVACCLHPWYVSIEEVLKRQRDAFALVYMHRVTTAGRYMALARDNQPRAHLVYSVADLHHLRLARQAEIEQQPALLSLSEHVRLAELAAAWQADAVITHSTAEAALLRQHMPASKVHVVPWSLPLRPTAVAWAGRRGFAFIGGYGHRPNVDAAHWLVDTVMPALDALGRSIPCSLVGSNMPDSLRNLRRHNVDPVGYVPELSTIFDRVRVTVAPLAYGAGVKGKVLDSLAAGVPCVCTPAAAEGLDLPEALLRHVAATPAELARSICTLHDDEALNRACSDAGLKYIADKASEARLDESMRSALGKA